MAEAANMVNFEPLRCQRCNKPIGYVKIVAKSSLEAKPNIDNLLLDATCLECGGTGFYSVEHISEISMF